MKSHPITAAEVHPIVEKILRVERLIGGSFPSDDELNWKRIADRDLPRLGTRDFIEEAITSGILAHRLEAVKTNTNSSVRDREIAKIHDAVNVYQDNQISGSYRYLITQAILRLEQNGNLDESKRRELAKIHQMKGVYEAVEFVSKQFPPAEPLGATNAGKEPEPASADTELLPNPTLREIRKAYHPYLEEEGTRNRISKALDKAVVGKPALAGKNRETQEKTWSAQIVRAVIAKDREKRETA